MFKCSNCEKPSPKGSKPVMVVLEERTKVYPRREGVIRKFVEGKVFYQDDPGGVGHEIVRESLMCGKCATMERSFYVGAPLT